MKIKFDFVTNSSSTSFVCIKPTDEMMDKFVDGIEFDGDEFEELDIDENLSDEESNKIVLDKVKEVMKSDSIWEEENWSLYYPIAYALKEAGLCITSMDTYGGGGTGQITFINKDEIKEKLNKLEA